MQEIINRLWWLSTRIMKGDFKVIEHTVKINEWKILIWRVNYSHIFDKFLSFLFLEYGRRCDGPGVRIDPRHEEVSSVLWLENEDDLFSVLREEEVPDPAAPAEGEYAEYTEEQQYAVGQHYILWLDLCKLHITCFLSCTLKFTVCLKCRQQFFGQILGFTPGGHFQFNAFHRIEGK